MRSSHSSPLRTTRIAVTRGCIASRLGAGLRMRCADTHASPCSGIAVRARRRRRVSKPASAARAAQPAALALGEPAPDAEPLVVRQRVVEALRLDLACRADLLRVARRSALLREEGLGIGLRAQRVGLPGERDCRRPRRDEPTGCPECPAGPDRRTSPRVRRDGTRSSPFPTSTLSGRCGRLPWLTRSLEVITPLSLPPRQVADDISFGVIGVSCRAGGSGCFAGRPRARHHLVERVPHPPVQVACGELARRPRSGADPRAGAARSRGRSRSR